MLRIYDRDHQGHDQFLVNIEVLYYYYAIEKALIARYLNQSEPTIIILDVLQLMINRKAKKGEEKVLLS